MMAKRDTITSHLVVRDAARAVGWYTKALGGEELSRVPLPGGKLMSVELRFGDSVVRLADEFPELDLRSTQTTGGTSVVFHLNTTDADALWTQAIRAGAQVLHPLEDTFWGNRQGQIQDPFGHRWNISQHLRDVPKEEVARAAARAFGATTP